MTPCGWFDDILVTGMCFDDAVNLRCFQQIRALWGYLLAPHCAQEKPPKLAPVPGLQLPGLQSSGSGGCKWVEGINLSVKPECFTGGIGGRKNRSVSYLTW